MSLFPNGDVKFCQIPVKLQKLLDDPSVMILRYLGQKQDVRYIEIQNNVRLSRSRINGVIHNLEDIKFIGRRISSGKPIEVYYYITPKGKEAFAYFERLRSLI